MVLLEGKSWVLSYCDLCLGSRPWRRRRERVLYNFVVLGSLNDDEFGEILPFWSLTTRVMNLE